LTKLAQLTELHVAVGVALHELLKPLGCCNKALDQWLSRISLVIQAKGAHVEHRLD